MDDERESVLTAIDLGEYEVKFEPVDSVYAYTHHTDSEI